MSLVGVDGNWKQDALLGALVGAAFIVVNKISPVIALGLPSFPFALETESKWLILVLVAPVLEEAFFRGILLNAVKTFTGASDAIAILLQALAFSAFHATAYAAGLAYVPVAFVGALIFGIIAGLLVKYSNSLLPGMIAHSIFNAYLTYSSIVIIGGI